MMDYHARAARMFRYQQQCWDVTLISCEADRPLDVSIPLSYGMDNQLGHSRQRESQQLGQTPTQALCLHTEALYGHAEQRGVFLVTHSRCRAGHDFSEALLASGPGRSQLSRSSA